MREKKSAREIACMFPCDALRLQGINLVYYTIHIIYNIFNHAR